MKRFTSPQPGTSSAVALPTSDESGDEDKDADVLFFSASDTSTEGDDELNDMDKDELNEDEDDIVVGKFEVLHSDSGTESSEPPSEDNDDLLDSDDSDDEGQFYPVRGRRRTTIVQPGSDDDPDPPAADDFVYPPDRYGWSRTLKTINIHKFKGTIPQGPSMNRSDDDDHPSSTFSHSSPSCSLRRSLGTPTSAGDPIRASRSLPQQRRLGPGLGLG